VATVASVVALVAAAVSLVCVLALTRWYLPPAGDSARWSDVQGLAALTFFVAAGVALVAIGVEWRRGRAGWWTLAPAVVGATAAVVVVLTRPLVRWDQLGLWAVTVGQGFTGYWTAAFDSGVRFVFVDGVQVEPGTYATALVVHLGAAVVGVVASTVLVRQVLRGRRTPA